MKKKVLGIASLLVSLLLVGNVYAEQKNVDFFFGEVKDVTSTKGDTIDGNVKVTITHSDDRSEYTFTYDEASLKYVPVDSSQNRDIEAAWVGIHVDNAITNAVVNGRFSMSTGESKEAEVSSYTIGGQADSEAWNGYVWFHVTKEEMEKAIRENNGVYTRKLEVKWKVKDSNDNKVGTQTITINVKAAGVTLQAQDSETLWDEKTYEDTVKKVEAEKLAQQNANKQDDIEEKGTEEDGELDDAPETSDVFPMALVGMISLGLAGTYVVKKLHN